MTIERQESMIDAIHSASRQMPAAKPLVDRALDGLARHWLPTFILITGAWVVLPWLAPVFMKLGWELPARGLYFFYSFQCHQLPQRSFFLFGPKAMYSLSELQASGVDSLNPAVLRQFIGNAELGYKVAWSDRMVSAYGSIPLAALFWWPLRGRLRGLPWWGFALLSLPMAIDGFSHFFSDFSGMGQGFRYTNEWLARLTSNALPAWFYAGNALGSFNSWMRLITGALFGFGLVWFVFPFVDAGMSEPVQTSHVRAGPEGAPADP